MGGLSHYLEEEGLATTQVSLIREHTETIKPPRALWVPFELGRPIGVPNDPAFQTEVVTEALKLLEAPNGPVIKDFPKDAPFRETDGGPLACPVNFSPRIEEITEIDRLLSAFRQEVSLMRNWYDLSLEKRGRTTANSSGLSPDEILEFIGNFIQNESTESPASELGLATALKLAIEDLKAYYNEAVTIQPGQPTDTASLTDWFWGQTTAARIINEVRTRCADHTDDNIKRTANLIIPRNQLYRFND